MPARVSAFSAKSSTPSEEIIKSLIGPFEASSQTNDKKQKHYTITARSVHNPSSTNPALPAL
jgi:hypothetical protein